MDRYTDVSLYHRNTFKMDVSASILIDYDTVDELKEVVASYYPSHRLLHIGGGSNLLFLRDFQGVILHSRIQDCEVVNTDDDHVWIRVGSGVVWDDFVAYCVKQGWGGVENLSHIPGEVGACAIQNIGAYGVEAKDVIEKVETIELATLNERSFGVDECDYGYRTSIFKRALKGQYVVTHVTFCLDKVPQFRLEYGNVKAELERRGEEITVQAVRQVIVDIRNSKLPNPEVLGNGGSFFMNPVIDRAHFNRLHVAYPAIPYYEVDAERVKIPAAWLIDQCGWKGRSMGRAAVHDKQPLVLVNTGGATGDEIWTLAETVQHAVAEKFGINIHPEVIVI